MPQCVNCQLYKEVSQFHKRGDNRYRSECAACRNEKRRAPLPILKPKESIGGKAEVTQNGNTAIATTVSTRIKTLEQLLDACQVDLNEWKVSHYTCNSWEQNSQHSGIVTLYQVKAQLQRTKAIVTEFPVIHPVHYDAPTSQGRVTVSNSQYRTALIVPDMHVGYLRNYKTCEMIPMHDERAIAVMLQLIDIVKPDRVVCLGDALDLGEMSIKWQSTPDMQYTTQESLNYLARLFAQIRQALPDSEIDYICGNHEARIEKAVLTNLTAAYGLTQACLDGLEIKYPVMSVPHLLGLDNLGVTYHEGYPDAEVWLNPFIRCIHGMIVKQDGGETSKAILNQSMLTNTICGHIHRAEIAYKTFHTHQGMVTRFAASPGTLGRLDGVIPGNGKRQNWQQGLLLVHYHDTNDYHSLEPINIDSGKVVFRGQLLEA